MCFGSKATGANRDNASTDTHGLGLSSSLFVHAVVQSKRIHARSVYAAASAAALFKATTGRSPRQLQIDERLDAAIEHIVTTSDPISEIAYALGYQNVSSFIRLFKRRLGLAPTEFRAVDRRRGEA